MFALQLGALFLKLQPNLEESVVGHVHREPGAALPTRTADSDEQAVPPGHLEQPVRVTWSTFALNPNFIKVGLVVVGVNVVDI